MISTIQILVVLLAVIAAVGVLAARLQIPPAILLVLTGVVLAFVPGLPTLELAPELVLLLVLPPVIYSSAVAMSWSEFRLNLRPIALLAVGCVVFTTIAILLIILTCFSLAHSRLGPIAVTGVIPSGGLGLVLVVVLILVLLGRV